MSLALDIGLCTEMSGPAPCLQPATVLIADPLAEPIGSEHYGVCADCQRFYSQELRLAVSEATGEQLAFAQRVARRAQQKLYVRKLAHLRGDGGNLLRATQVFSNFASLCEHCGISGKGEDFLRSKYTQTELSCGFIELAHPGDGNGNGFGLSWHPISWVIFVGESRP